MQFTFNLDVQSKKDLDDPVAAIGFYIEHIYTFRSLDLIFELFWYEALCSKVRPWVNKILS